MNTPKNHHYVPVWYLRNFLNPKTGMLSVYDIKKKEWREHKPSKIMLVKHYNRQEWVPEGIDVNIYERLLSDLESQGKIAIEKLIYNPKKLSGDEMAMILTYLDMQRVRVPRQAKIAKKMISEFIHSIAYKNSDIANSLKSKSIKIVIDDKKARFKYLRATQGVHVPYFSKMKWSVFNAPDSVSFVTTDSPVSFFNPKFPPPLEPGISLVGTIVLFPLSSKHLLLLQHPEFEEDPSIPPTKHIMAEPLQDRQISFDYNIQVTAEMVCRSNEMLVCLADRYVVAENKSFIKRSLTSIYSDISNNYVKDQKDTAYSGASKK